MYQSLILRIADAFNKNGIPYMIVGGQAILLYGEPRMTQDIDITLGFDIDEYEKIKKNKLKNKTNENKSKNIQAHPQAIYISRLLNFKNLPEPVNSTDYLSSFQGKKI